MTRYTICARPSSVYVPVEADSPQEAVEAFLRVNAYEIESVDWAKTPPSWRVSAKRATNRS